MGAHHTKTSGQREQLSPFFILPALKVGGRRTGSAWRPLGESLEQIHIEYSTRFPGRISPVVYRSREVLFALDDERLYQAD